MPTEKNGRKSIKAVVATTLVKMGYEIEEATICARDKIGLLSKLLPLDKVIADSKRIYQDEDHNG